MDTVLETACQITKHRKSDAISVADISIAGDRNFEIYEPSKYSGHIYKQKSQEIKTASTVDHKRRVELTKEETKNINF